MKNRKPLLFRTTGLFTVLVSGAIFFAGCKKDISAEKYDGNTDASDETSQSISAAAATLNEGFGSQAVGGANSSTVYHVTNLNASGSGSLAAGIGSNKTIVFDVSGTITARLYLASVSYLTIDATGKDIIINGNNNGDAISMDGPNTHHIIIKGLTVTNAGGDGMNVVSGAHDILITNCSSYGNRDGNIDIAGDNSSTTKNVTVQWCILGTGVSGSDYSGDMLITGQNVTAHHNLFVPAGPNVVGERCPLVHCNYSPVGAPNADFRNNVIWKFGRNNATGSGYGTDVAYSATANVVNNYYYSPSDGGNAVVVNGSYGSTPKGNAYVAGNVSGNTGVNPNSQSNHAEYAIASQYAVTTQDACTAAQLVLSQAGPRPLNSANLALVNSVALTGCSVTPPSNQNPTANAGNDQTITLPTSLVSLNGSGSDPDGSIASYAWSKVSGTGGTITSANAATTTITGLTAGSYTFKLTVTDDKGATASDNVTITVNNAVVNNILPTVSAGSNQTITLPTSSASLSGSASDPDGTIASYAWSKVSGTGGTITSPATAATTVTGLTAGSYTFKLTVTDNKGATASANVSVTVNAAAPPSGGGGYGTAVFSQGYNSASTVTTNQGRRNSVSTTLYSAGPGSFRSEVRAGDPCLSGGFRSEMAYTSTAQNPVEGVTEYDVYYQNWSGFDGGGGTIAWNPSTSGAGSLVSLQNYGGKFDVVRAIGSTVTHQSGTLMSVASNTWYKMRWEYKWSTGTDGYVRLYINNVLYYSFTGKTSDGSTISFRVGQNRWPNSGSSMQVTSVCYYDNLTIYKK
ncbi:MAG: hypothetical protein E6H09_16350 [Bacteroidetes bacterium]|nr:MAG: hypothetical protein E6H09_16350 [Bacteroidota bacterium]